MTFDTEAHKQLVIHLIDQSNFSGAIAEEIVKLKTSVREAGVADKKAK